MGVGLNGLVLDTTEASPSDGFWLPDGGIYQIVCEVHAGGTWQLEHRPADGTGAWSPTDASEDSFSDEKTINVYTSPGMQYRLSGGTTGARFRVMPVEAQGGPIEVT